MRAHRFPNTVLFTDIVGSTEKAATLGDMAWGELLAEFHADVRREIRGFGGREINMAGDGFLAAFQHPAAAIRCAWAIRDSVRALGLEVRSGIHAGEVAAHGQELGGIAVHIGSRVATTAGPGEILVTSTVRELVTGTGFQFEDRGEVNLRGVPERWRIFALSSLPAGPAFRTGRWIPEITVRQGKVIGLILASVAVVLIAYATLGRHRATVPSETLYAAPGVAVVPFRITDPDLDLWREGMVDLLSTNLDGAGGLRAIDSRTMMARWREAVPEGVEPDLATTLDIARKTRARYVLLGSMVSSESSFQLVAEIYDAESGEMLGQARAAGPADSVFVLVDRLAVESLRVMLGSGATELPKVWNLRSTTTSSLAALKAYLEGENLYRRARFEEAALAYERAVAADSTFALALYRLASTYGWLENISGPGPRKYLERALQFAERLPQREAVFVRGSYALHTGTLEGIRPLQMAVRQFPDDPEAWWLLGDTYAHLGQQALIDEAAVDRTLGQAIELAPEFSPYYIHMIERASRNGRRDEAARLTERYGRLASGSRTDRRNRLGIALAFGDSASRARTLSSIDTIPSDIVAAAAGFYLSDADDAAVKELVILNVRGRSDAGPLSANLLFFHLLNRGRLREAYEESDDPLLSPGLRAYARYALFSRGLPLSEEEWDEGLGSFSPDTSPELGSFYAGAYAVVRNHWRDHAQAVNRQRDYAERLQAADTVAARFHAAAAGALEGYGLWKRGRPEEALVLLKAVQLQATGAGERNRLNATIREWLGELLLELDRPEEAVDFYASQWEDAFASFRLGNIFESLGEGNRAMNAYAYALSAWEQADPELAPRVSQARRFLMTHSDPEQ
ncbi:MAG: adenylate/guanylate cyclase domain-containing protein [Gemmatimonadota bacterium]